MHVFWGTDEASRKDMMAWAGKFIPHVGEEGDFDSPYQVAEVVNDNGERLAVIIFHDWQEEARTIQVSAASVSPFWAHPSVICSILQYPFDVLKVRKLWMAIPHTYENVIKFNKHLGFRQEATLRYHFSDTQHAVILSMLEEEYRKSRWCGDDAVVQKEFNS